MNIKRSSIFSFSLLVLIAARLQAVEVKIVFPPKGSTLAAGKQTFVAGRIKPADGQLTINGKTIVPYRTGSFVYMQPIKKGRNTLNIKSGSYNSRHSFFLRAPVKKESEPAITPIFPHSSAGILTGKTFHVSCKAPARSNPRVLIGERTLTLKAGPSPERWSAPLRFYCPLSGVPVTFFAKNLPDVSAGMLSALKSPESFEVVGKLFSTRARAQPDSGATIAFLKPGDIILCDGFHGNHRTTRINGKRCYVNSKYLKAAKPSHPLSPRQQPADMAAGFGPHPPTSKKLEDILIALDAGHGGADSGAVGPSGLTEKEMTLKQIKLLEVVLKKAGYQTMLTRGSDVSVGLYDRARAAYTRKADAFISIHYNSCPSQHHPDKKRHLSTYAWNDIGKALAKPINAELGKISPTRNAGVLHGNFAVCRNPAVPSILIELDFITSPKGEELIQRAEFQQKSAAAILKGLRRWHR